MRQYFSLFVDFFSVYVVVHNLFFLFIYVVKRQPKLKSKYQGCVEKAIEYAKTVESWDDLVDSQTFVFYCLGPDPSPYVLRIIDIEGKE